MTSQNESHGSYLLVLRPIPPDTRRACLNGQMYCSDFLDNRGECERIDPLTYLESANREKKEDVRPQYRLQCLD